MSKVKDDSASRIRIEYMPLSELRRAPRNAKLHNDEAIRQSFERFGFISPVIMNESTGRLVAGHGRLDNLIAAKDAGRPMPDRILPHPKNSDWLVPVIRGIEFANDAEAEAYLVADNQLTISAGFDDELLAQQLNDLVAARDGDYAAALAGTGYDEELLRALDDSLGKLSNTPVVDDDPGPLIDKAAELQTKWGTERGQIWEIGIHRLMCGDSTRAEDVSALLNGKHAALCLTDPPYGIGENYDGQEDTRETLAALVAGFMPLALKHSERILLTPGNSNQRLYPPPDWTLCWFVPAGTGMNRWGFSCWQPVLAYGKDPYLAEGKGSRPDGLELTESADNTLGHPVSKPVKVWTWFMERGSIHRGDIVLDFFAGSGTGYVAAEQLGRVLYGMEISPGYCGVILERMTALGPKARLL